MLRFGALLDSCIIFLATSLIRSLSFFDIDLARSSCWAVPYPRQRLQQDDAAAAAGIAKDDEAGGTTRKEIGKESTLAVAAGGVRVEVSFFGCSVDATYDDDDVRAIPSNYAGFSVEYSGAAELTGGNATHVAIYSQLLRNLADASLWTATATAKSDGGDGRASPHRLRRRGAANNNNERAPTTIRIGGNSADHSCYVHPDQPFPSAQCKHRILDEDLMNLAKFASTSKREYSLGVGYVVDTNLGVSSNPQDVALPHIKRLGDFGLWDWISAVEVGNEINLYAKKGIYRNASYTEADYELEFARYLRAYLDAGGMPHGIVQGGTWCCFSVYLDELDRYLAKFREELNSFSYHVYSLHGARGHTFNASDVDNYQAQLLGERGVDEIVRRLTPLINVAKRHRVPFKLGETNSANLGGIFGVSDSYASALWAVDYLASLSKAGVAQVLFHTGDLRPSVAYTAFAYDPGADHVQVRPLYYGILLFNELIANESHWLGTTISVTPKEQYRRRSDADPRCQNGLLKFNFNVCCALECGTCGGSGCASLPGGPSSCCTSTILANNISCDNSTAPCVLNTSGDGDPIVSHATYSESRQTVKVLVAAKRPRAAADEVVKVCMPKQFCSQSPLSCLVGKVIRLTAPSIHSKYTDEITLGGQTFRNTIDGKPVGKRQEEVVVSNIDPLSGSWCFDLTVQPLSALLLTVEGGTMPASNERLKRRD